MNNEKRLLLALAFSFVILAFWSNFAGKPGNPVNQQTYPQASAVSAAPSPEKAKSEVLPKLVVPPPAPQAFFELKQGNKKISFAEPLGAISAITFADYQGYEFPLKNGLQVGDPGMVFERQSVATDGVTYAYSDREKKITKRFVFTESGYVFDLYLTVENLSNAPLNFQSPLALGTLDPASSKDRMAYHDVTVYASEKPAYPNFQKPGTFNQLKFIALRDRYFCAIIEPDLAGSSGFITKISPKESEIGLIASEVKIVPRGTLEQKFKVYVGPQDIRILKAIDTNWQAVIYFGKFDLIAQGLLMLLELFYNIFHNWGWAIVFLSLAVYLLLFPLTMKQMKSMKEMQLLQPKIEELRKSLKDNSQRLNKEIMELYKKHKVNPLGGCLPMVLQAPIFFVLYLVLSRSIALKGAGFFWIKDLSEPDKLLLLPTSLPFIGNEFNILPILMAIEMFFQQKLSTVGGNSSQAEQQKMMLIIMPIMFGFLFYRMPSGLVLYWFLNSTLSLIYQLRAKVSLAPAN